GTSIGTLIQTANNHTTVNGNQFCNSLSGVTLNDNAVATPYPSNIFVSGLSGTISKVTVDLKGLTESRPQDLSMLLVGPTGKTFVFFSDAGSTSSVNGINLNLDDTASSALPQSQLTTGTFKPASYLAGITFPSPAPAGPFGNAAPVGTATLGSVFNSTAPSGRWYLFAIDRSDR